MRPPEPAAVDLDDESRRALEFDALLEWVASYAATAPGRAKLAARVPYADAVRVRQELAAAGEARAYLIASGRLVAAGVDDPSAALAALRIAGLALAAKPLRELAAAGVAAAALRRVLRALAAADKPWLRATGESIPDLEADCRPILDGIEADGRLRDEASPELRRIRGEHARTAARLRHVLEKLVRSPASGAVIQDEFITQRNGRYVVPVRTDAPKPLRGIVHAVSSSGATQFVEPLATVELNNDLVRLGEQEKEETIRLLGQWSQRLRGRAAELEQALEGLAAVDDAQARALFAEDVAAVTPEVGVGRALVLREARHPLLERRLGEAGRGASVPLDLELDPADRVLVISGPNAGGKTVALKTLGLAALMAQSGIPLPAREARLPVFRQVRVDIGDHQSIQADLSTYSAHVRAVARFLDEAAPPALFLFDEIGSGTEPAEGAALARAVLDALVGRGITAVATTHLGELKEWAVGSGRAASAAMEFDAAELRPTFRILMGATGISAGLDIARRMGLPADLIERARGYLGPDVARREGYLQRLQQLVVQKEQEIAALVEERRRSAQALAERERDVELEREQWRRTATRDLERTVEELVERGRKELARIGDQAERRRQERRLSRTASELRSTAKQFEAQRATAAPAPGDPLPAAVPPGLAVHVLSLGRRGEVVEAAGARVKVRVGGLVLDTERADLRVDSGSPVRETRPAPAQRAARDEPSSAAELMLLGLTVDDALAAVDRFLDSALVAGREEVRLVHGHGTGRLRQAVRGFLRGHAAVRAQRPGRPEEGGDGATVVTLI